MEIKEVQHDHEVKVFFCFYDYKMIVIVSTIFDRNFLKIATK